MCVLFCYPDPPLLYRELPDLGLDRVLLHLVVFQFLIQCLYYENNTPRRELIDFCNKDGDVCLWEWMFRDEWRLFYHARGARLWLV